MNICKKKLDFNLILSNMEKFYEKTPCVKFGWIDEDGKIVYVKKRTYETDKEAIEAARILNTKENRIQKVVTYKCPKCFKWHVGRNGNELTEKDKKHYKEKKIK